MNRYITIAGGAPEIDRRSACAPVLRKGSLLSKRTLAAGVLAFAAAISAAGAASGAASTTYVIKATLDTRHEVPAPKDAKNAKGTLTAKLTVAGKKSTFVWQLSFSGLSGTA